MLICTTWKSRPLLPEQTHRLMDTWGKIEAATAENPSVERLCWYINADGSGGVTVVRTLDDEAAAAFQLETGLALGEFLDIDSNVVLDLDAAMGPILKAVSYLS